MENEILPILLEIKKILANSTPVWVTTLIATSGTLLGVAFTSIAQYMNNKASNKAVKEAKELEVKSHVVSKQRQEWMDTLRENSASFLAAMDSYLEGEGSQSLDKEEELQIYQKFCQKGTLLVLMLNPNKDEQKNAIDTIQGILGVMGENYPETKYDELRDQLLSQLQKIFEETWRQIKSME